MEQSAYHATEDCGIELALLLLICFPVSFLSPCSHAEFPIPLLSFPLGIYYKSVGVLHLKGPLQDYHWPYDPSKPMYPQPRTP